MSTSTFHTNGVHALDAALEQSYDADLDELYAWWPLEAPPVETPSAPAPAPATLPEAALSLTLKGTLGGIEAMLTIRGQSPAEFQAHLQAVRGLLDAPAQPAPACSPQPAPPVATTPLCPTHGAMKPSTKGKGWYCPHKDSQGQWCPSKAR
jgi:hypothetical protein